MTQLIIHASSAALRHRLERAAAHLLARVPDDVAAFLARSVIVYAIEANSHGGVCFGHPSAPEDPARRLVAERERQTGQPQSRDPIFVILISAGSLSLVDVLGHELAHAWRRDPLAALSTSPEEEDAMERATEQLARSWLASPVREDP